MSDHKTNALRAGRHFRHAFRRFFYLSALILTWSCKGQALPEPNWWNTLKEPSQPVLDNHAAASAGQLKNFAHTAMLNMDGYGYGAGDAIHGMVEAWLNDAAANNYTVVNAGQLKNVAKLFYDRLAELGMGLPEAYPWTDSEDNNAAVNVGQLKNVFSFELPPSAVKLSIVSGDEQCVPANQVALLPLTVSLSNGVSGRSVTFTTTPGSVSVDGMTWAGSATVTTDNGTAAVYFKAGDAGTLGSVTATLEGSGVHTVFWESPENLVLEVIGASSRVGLPASNQPLAIHVKGDSSGKAIPGVPVSFNFDQAPDDGEHFNDAGSANAGSSYVVTTDASGFAKAVVHLPSSDAETMRVIASSDSALQASIDFATSTDTSAGLTLLLEDIDTSTFPLDSSATASLTYMSGGSTPVEGAPLFVEYFRDGEPAGTTFVVTDSYGHAEIGVNASPQPCVVHVRISDGADALVEFDVGSSDPIFSIVVVEQPFDETAPGSWASSPITIYCVDHTGAPVPGSSVLFQTSSPTEGGRLSFLDDDSQPLEGAILVQADSFGYARAYFKAGDTPNATETVTANCFGKQVSAQIQTASSASITQNPYNYPGDGTAWNKAGSGTGTSTAAYEQLVTGTPYSPAWLKAAGLPYAVIPADPIWKPELLLTQSSNANGGATITGITPPLTSPSDPSVRLATDHWLLMQFDSPAPGSFSLYNRTSPSLGWKPPPYGPGYKQFLYPHDSDNLKQFGSLVAFDDSHGGYLYLAIGSTVLDGAANQEATNIDVWRADAAGNWTCLTATSAPVTTSSATKTTFAENNSSHIAQPPVTTTTATTNSVSTANSTTTTVVTKTVYVTQTASTITTSTTIKTDVTSTTTTPITIPSSNIPSIALRGSALLVAVPDAQGSYAYGPNNIKSSQGEVQVFNYVTAAKAYRKLSAINLASQYSLRTAVEKAAMSADPFSANMNFQDQFRAQFGAAMHLDDRALFITALKTSATSRSSIYTMPVALIDDPAVTSYLRVEEIYTPGYTPPSIVNPHGTGFTPLFGTSFATVGNLLLIGSPGSVSVYGYTNPGWNYLTSISDLNPAGGALFGSRLGFANGAFWSVEGTTPAAPGLTMTSFWYKDHALPPYETSPNLLSFYENDKVVLKGSETDFSSLDQGIGILPASLQPVHPSSGETAFTENTSNPTITYSGTLRRATKVTPDTPASTTLFYLHFAESPNSVACLMPSGVVAAGISAVADANNPGLWRVILTNGFQNLAIGTNLLRGSVAPKTGANYEIPLPIYKKADLSKSNLTVSPFSLPKTNSFMQDVWQNIVNGWLDAGYALIQWQWAPALWHGDNPPDQMTYSVWVAEEYDTPYPTKPINVQSVTPFVRVAKGLTTNVFSYQRPRILDSVQNRLPNYLVFKVQILGSSGNVLKESSEYRYPFDTDRDGLPDTWAKHFGVDGMVGSTKGATGNADSDYWNADGTCAYTNLDEYLHNTDPLNEQDSPGVTGDPGGNNGTSGTGGFDFVAYWEQDFGFTGTFQIGPGALTQAPPPYSYFTGSYVGHYNWVAWPSNGFATNGPPWTWSWNLRFDPNSQTSLMAGWFSAFSMHPSNQLAEFMSAADYFDQAHSINWTRSLKSQGFPAGDISSSAACVCTVRIADPRTGNRNPSALLEVTDIYTEPMLHQELKRVLLQFTIPDGATAASKVTSTVLQGGAMPPNLTIKSRTLDNPIAGIDGVALIFANAPAVNSTRFMQLKTLPVQIDWVAVPEFNNLSDNKSPVDFVWGIQNPVAADDGRWMPGRGLRIFPDQETPTSPLRNRVRLKIKAGSIRPDKKVFVRVYDVDDPTPRGFDQTSEVDPNGDAGGDNIGSDQQHGGDFHFVSGSSVSNASTQRSGNGQVYASCDVTLDENNEALIEMQVSMQPGDNFRAAVAFDPSDFSAIQVTSPGTSGFLKPSGDFPVGFTGGVSQMLTVWRTLHLEFDSMSAIPIGDNKPDRVTSILGLHWSSDRQLDVVRLDEQAAPYDLGVEDNFYRHGFAIVGNQTLELDGNIGSSLIFTQPVDQATQGLMKNQLFTICDDDLRGLPSDYMPLLPKQIPITDKLRARFVTSYIELTDVGALNLTTEVPFEDNHVVSLGGLLNFSVSSGRDVQDTYGYWNHLVVAAYQPEAWQDGDPSDETPLLGVTIPFAPKYSLIYLEAIRDQYGLNLISANPALVASGQEAFVRDVQGCVAHELGHVPSHLLDNEHIELGLMGQGEVDIDAFVFNPITVRRFRKAISWGSAP